MLQTLPKLVAETNALMRMYDSVADVGADLSIWERDHPACVDVLYAWANDRNLGVKVRSCRDGAQVWDAFEVGIQGHHTITAYR